MVYLLGRLESPTYMSSTLSTLPQDPHRAVCESGSGYPALGGDSCDDAALRASPSLDRFPLAEFGGVVGWIVC